MRISFFVLLLFLGISCSGKENVGPSYCEATPVSPSCSTGEFPISPGQHLSLPTEIVRFPNETDPSTRFPGRVQLISLTPLPGSVVRTPFSFTYNLKLYVDETTVIGEGVTIEIFPSNDGVIPSGPSIGGGFVRSVGEGSFPDGSPGMITMMHQPFKFILVNAKWARSGVGMQYSHYAFQVDYE